MSNIGELQRHGYRRTNQRELILRILEESGRHMTAGQVVDAIQTSGERLNRSTVYRTLETLVDVGMVKASRAGRAQLYEMVHDGHRHHHLVCSACGSAVHVDGADVDAVLAGAASKAGFTVSEIQVLVAGLCRACRRAGAKESA